MTSREKTSRLFSIIKNYGYSRLFDFLNRPINNNSETLPFDEPRMVMNAYIQTIHSINPNNCLNHKYEGMPAKSERLINPQDRLEWETHSK